MFHALFANCTIELCAMETAENAPNLSQLLCGTFVVADGVHGMYFIHDCDIEEHLNWGMCCVVKVNDPFDISIV